MYVIDYVTNSDLMKWLWNKSFGLRKSSKRKVTKHKITKRK